MQIIISLEGNKSFLSGFNFILLDLLPSQVEHKLEKVNHFPSIQFSSSNW